MITITPFAKWQKQTMLILSLCFVLTSIGCKQGNTGYMQVQQKGVLHQQALSQMHANHFHLADDSFKQYLSLCHVPSKADHVTAGLIAYSTGDSLRAMRHWSHLNTTQIRQLIIQLQQVDLSPLQIVHSF